MSKLSELFDSLSDQERQLIEGILPPHQNTDELLSLDVREFTLKLRNSLSLEQLVSLSDAEIEFRGELMDWVIVAWRDSKDSKQNDDSEVSDNNLGNGNGDLNDDSSPNNKSNIKKIELAFKKAEEVAKPLFKDQYGVCYGWLDISGHKEVIAIESGKFKRLLFKLFHENVGHVPSQGTIDGWVHMFHALADFEGDNTYPLSLRTAWHNGDIYYDMTNDKWQSVKITPEGWTLEGKTPIPMFARYKQTPQAEPDRNYDGDIFDKFLQLTNLKEEEDRILLSVYIISLFIPDIQHVISQIHGEKGSAKSMLQTLIKDLVDPTKPKLLTIYNDQKEFIQQLAHNYLAFYDNLKFTPRWLSDEACKACTGVGSTKRKLFSNDDDIVYEYRRGLGFNGINLGLTEPDLLDRSIMVELQRIGKESRRQESEIMAEFLQVRPQLLGYIFDILVKALRIKPTIKLDDLPRMADFAIWGEAIARAMGYRDLEFISVYYDNIGKQNVEAIENSALGQAISRFVKVKIKVEGAEEAEERPCSWQGAMSQALDCLNTIAAENNIDTSKDWPKAPNSLSRKLKPILSNLREGLDINVVMFRSSTGSKKGKGTHMLRVYKIYKISSPSSPSSLDQFHEGNPEEKSEDISESDDIYRHQGTISSPKSIENRVQNPPGDGSDNSDGLLGNNRVRSPSSTIDPDPDQDFKCYHKGCDFTTNSDRDYRRHGAQYHPKNPLLYPSKAEIGQYGLTPQGRDWEV